MTGDHLYLRGHWTGVKSSKGRETQQIKGPGNQDQSQGDVMSRHRRGRDRAGRTHSAPEQDKP